jgi:hypothetical protein
MILLASIALADAPQPVDGGLSSRWSKTRAISDAAAVIAGGDLYVYATGGIACRPEVADEDMSLARTLRQRPIACGCVVWDFSLRATQVQYARIFNEQILVHLKTTAHRER